MDNNQSAPGGDAYKFQVDLKGIIKLLSDNLYSDDSVFLRELLQNAVDAVSSAKLNTENFPGGEIRITYNYLPDGRSAELLFEDNGIGLTEEEIHQFLSIIGKSSKSAEKSRSSYIGQFGIGLLSCFLVADIIEVRTRSRKEDIGYLWSGKADGTYDVIELNGEVPPGTRIRLIIKGSMYEKYRPEDVMEQLMKYGYMLDIPIYFSYDGLEEQLNGDFIPWKEPMHTKNQALEFGTEEFDTIFLDAFPIAENGIVGYAFVSGQPTGMHTVNNHKIYLKDMFITDKGEQLIPSWAFFIKCILNFTDLTPTASREGFYRDNKLLKAKSTIEKAVYTYLKELAMYDQPRLKMLLSAHNVAIKSMLVSDDKLYPLLFPFISFSTNTGQRTGAELLALSKKTTIYYCSDTDRYKKMSPLLDSSHKFLINAGYIYDTALLDKLRKFHKSVSVKPLEDDSLNSILADDKDESFDRLIETACRTLKPYQCKAYMKSFVPSELPCLYGGDDAGSYSIEQSFFGESGFFEEDDDSFFEDDGLLAMTFSSLYLNSESPVIRKLSAIPDDAVLETVVQLLYFQGLLMSGGKLGAESSKMLSQNLIKLIDLCL